MGRKLVIQEFITLDGVMQAPGTKDEDTRGGFTHGGWQIPYYDEAIIGIMMERYAASDALLFGQRTYEAFAAYWPTAPADDPFAGEMNRLKKYVVAADDIDTVAWQNSERITGDVVAEIAKEKKLIVLVTNGPRTGKFDPASGKTAMYGFPSTARPTAKTATLKSATSWRLMTSTSC